MKGMLWTRCLIEGRNAEKLLNVFREEGITLRRVHRTEQRSIDCVCDRADFERLAEIAGGKGFAVKQLPAFGARKTLQGLRRRKGLLVGLMVFAALLFTSMRFVWVVRIEDAGMYVGEVRSFLLEKDIKVGMMRSKVDVIALKEALEWRLPKVAWVQVEQRGVEVVVRWVEGVETPDVITPGGEGDVVADRDGILVRLTTYAGTPVAKAGDLIKKGQVLIKGEERSKEGELVPVKARGEAIARVWLSTKVELPLMETVSVPTGNTALRRMLVTPVYTLYLDAEPMFLTSDCDVRITTVGGVWLPITYREEWYEEVAIETQQRDIEQVKQEAAKAAGAQLAEKTFLNQDLVDKWIDFSMIDGDTICATATAEMLRDIARFVKR